MPRDPTTMPICSPSKVSTIQRGQSILIHIRGRPFWTPYPPCPRFGLISSSKPTQPPLLRPLLGIPPSPLGVDVLYGWPLSTVELVAKSTEGHFQPFTAYRSLTDQDILKGCEPIFLRGRGLIPLLDRHTTTSL